MHAESAFEKEKTYFKSLYPRYASHIDENQLWYADFRFFRSPLAVGNGYLLPSTSEIEFRINRGLPEEGGYWNPPSNFHAHMRVQAQQEIQRLNPIKSYTRNIDFTNHPVRYGREFSEKEVNETVRLESFGLIKNSLSERAVIQKASYLDQVGTNITCSVPITSANNQTFRQIDSSCGKLKPLSECVSANTIGVAALFVDARGEGILRWRKFNPEKQRKDSELRKFGAMQEGWHCTSSGVLTWSDIEKGLSVSATESAGVVAGFHFGMQREIERETGLRPDEYDLHLFAYARELKRAGKPQLFFVAILKEGSVSSIPGTIKERGPAEKEEYKDFAIFNKNFYYFYEKLKISLGSSEFCNEIRKSSDMEYFTYEGYAISFLYSAYLTNQIRNLNY